MNRRRIPTGDAPLLAWGEALCARRARRKRLCRIALVAAAGAFALGLGCVFPSVPRLVWNASPSMPLGLYYVSPGAQLAVGDMVVARIPQAWRSLAARRHYLPANVPAVKRVAAAAGEEVCALRARIFVNGVPVATRRAADPHGRRLPWWSGCVHLRGREVFLLTSRPDSFDGRYFGVSEGMDIVGKARLLWRR